MAEHFSFERLEAYQKALHLTRVSYALSNRFPSHEKYGLYSQLRRSIVSVASNIAESCGRVSYKEKIHFLEIAYGSLPETYCQLQIALQVGYISQSEFEEIKPNFFLVSRLVNALSRSYVKQLNP